MIMFGGVGILVGGVEHVEGYLGWPSQLSRVVILGNNYERTVNNFQY